MQRSDSVKTSADFEQFNTIAEAVANMTGVSRRILPLADGVLVVKQVNGGTTRTITVKAGVPEEIAITAFISAGSSGAVPIKVYR